MHYYKRNLGDYAKKAGRLSMLQHGAYNLLIDACYDRERFPTLEEAIEWTWASTDDEIQAVKFVLSRFFVLDSEGQYVQDRILQELLEYHQKSDKNKQIAIQRETKRKQSVTKRVRNVNESSPNQEPRTINQEPLKYIPPIPAELLSEWLAVRKKKPVTERVFNAVKKEAAKIGWTPEQAIIKCCERGWTGFESEWVTKEKQSSINSKQAAAMTAFGSLLTEYIRPVEKEI